MFGTEEAARIVTRELKTLSRVTDVLGNRIFYLPVYPHDAAFPGGLIYPQYTEYDGSIDSDGDPVFERVDLEVRFIAEGKSATPIRDAAKAQRAHLSNAHFDEVIDGHNWHVQFTPVSEVALPALMEGTSYYRQLGTVYTVEFTRG